MDGDHKDEDGGENVESLYQKGDFSSVQEGLENELRSFCDERPELADDWMQLLYERYTDRFLSDNGRIWTTGSILIPLSLASFAALPTISCPTTAHILVLAAVSLTLIVVWLVIAENHRAFQDKSLAWILAIENKYLGIKSPPAKIERNKWTEFLAGKGRVQRARWILTTTLSLGWLAILLWWPRGC